MDGKLHYPRFLLCKKPHKKTPIRREMTIFPKVSKTAVFAKYQGGGGTKGICSKMADFFSKLLKEKENRKYKSYHRLIKMDGKLHYPRLLLCKKPHEKTPIRR